MADAQDTASFSRINSITGRDECDLIVISDEEGSEIERVKSLEKRLNIALTKLNGGAKVKNAYFALELTESGRAILEKSFPSVSFITSTDITLKSGEKLILSHNGVVLRAETNDKAFAIVGKTKAGGIISGELYGTEFIACGSDLSVYERYSPKSIIAFSERAKDAER